MKIKLKIGLDKNGMQTCIDDDVVVDDDDDDVDHIYLYMYT